MTLGQNEVLRYGRFGEFWSFFGDIMANLGLIDFKIGLHIKINVNKGKTFGQNGHQLALNWARTLIGHNSVNFHLISTFFF